MEENKVGTSGLEEDCSTLLYVGWPGGGGREEERRGRIEGGRRVPPVKHT